MIEMQIELSSAETEKFFWSMFCDNYLEIVKKRIYESKKGKESAQYTLYHSLLTILKLMAPIMPFITEEIYQEYYRNPKNSSNFGAQKTSGFLGNEKEKSIHISEWPKIVSSLDKSIENHKDSQTFALRGKASSKENSKFADEFDLFVEILSKVRQEKTKAQKSMKAEIDLTLSKKELVKIEDILDDLKDVTNSREIKEGSFGVEFDGQSGSSSSGENENGTQEAQDREG